MTTNFFLRSIIIVLITIFFASCGGGGGGDGDSSSVESNTTTSSSDDSTSSTDDFDTSEYKGLIFNRQNMLYTDYTLNQLSNDEFYALEESQRLLVADKLLGTLFFGYPLEELQEKIEAGDFIDSILQSITEEKIDKAWLEDYILDEEKFQQSTYNEQEAVDILTRFFVMDELDSYYLNNWVAYILTQTIMFSPSYELDTIHDPNISRVYNRLVTMLEYESGMRYISYVHMMTEDNWRRFRSPEDNGREMLEIFTLDKEDAHVPLAGQALKNWKLDSDSDTLVVSLNQNTEAISLFGTTIYNGDDFYRELAKSDAFTNGVASRLVDFFFPEETQTKKDNYISSILASNPETWQDILLQIIFSEAYLIDNSRAKSAEELFFSMAKKMNHQHRINSMHTLKDALEDMNQASMKYKLGKLKRVPLDTLSFANYHKYIRENVMLRKANSEKVDDYSAWDRRGWSESFISNDHFSFDGEDVSASLDSFVNYLFTATISREASEDELTLFREFMIIGEGDEQILLDTFNMFRTDTDPETQIERREDRKTRIAMVVLDYISRLSETYRQDEVN